MTTLNMMAGRIGKLNPFTFTMASLAYIAYKFCALFRENLQLPRNPDIDLKKINENVNIEQYRSICLSIINSINTHSLAQIEIGELEKLPTTELLTLVLEKAKEIIECKTEQNGNATISLPTWLVASMQNQDKNND